MTLEVRDVVHQDRHGPLGGSRGALTGASLKREAGAVAILGTPEDGTIALFELLIGACRPKRGSVRIGGADPAGSWEARKAIGSVGLEPALPAGGTVRAALRLASSVAPDTILEGAGLAALAARSIAGLTHAEARGVELALALATPKPTMLVLFEPFVAAVGLSEQRLRDRLAEIAESAIVLVLTSSAADAAGLGEILVLSRGAFLGPWSGSLGPNGAVELVLEVASKARALAGLLANQTVVRAVSLECLPQADASGTLRVRGTDRGALALAIADAAVELGADVATITEAAPSLFDVRLVTEWQARARHAAHRAAHVEHAELSRVGPLAKYADAHAALYGSAEPTVGPSALEPRAAPPAREPIASAGEPAPAPEPSAEAAPAALEPAEPNAEAAEPSAQADEPAEPKPDSVPPEKKGDT